MPNWLILILTAIVGAILKNASEPMRKFVEKWVKELQAKAKETPNPVDDMLADLLATILKVE